MGGAVELWYDASSRCCSHRFGQSGPDEPGRPGVRPYQQEKHMSQKLVFAAVLVLIVAACAKKQETVYAEQPVSQEPVFTGKYK
jgi:hypothetical protein